MTLDHITSHHITSHHITLHNMYTCIMRANMHYTHAYTHQWHTCIHKCIHALHIITRHCNTHIHTFINQCVHIPQHTKSHHNTSHSLQSLHARRHYTHALHACIAYTHFDPYKYYMSYMHTWHVVTRRHDMIWRDVTYIYFTHTCLHACMTCTYARNAYTHRTHPHTFQRIQPYMTYTTCCDIHTFQSVHTCTHVHACMCTLQYITSRHVTTCHCLKGMQYIHSQMHKYINARTHTHTYIHT